MNADEPAEIRNKPVVVETGDGLNYHRTRIWVLVKRRSKRQGMSWSIAGANDLLAMRCAYIDFENMQKFY